MSKFDKGRRRIIGRGAALLASPFVMKYAAAACVIAGLIGLVGIQLAQLKREPVATIARMDGSLETTLSGDEWQPASMNAPLAEGSRVRTGATARAALTITDVSLRMDVDTRIALVSANRISLERGAIYVDSGIDRTTARTRGALDSQTSGHRSTAFRSSRVVTPQQSQRLRRCCRIGFV